MIDVISKCRQEYINDRLKEAENLKRYLSDKQYMTLVRKIKMTNGFPLPLSTLNRLKDRFNP